MRKEAMYRCLVGLLLAMSGVSAWAESPCGIGKVVRVLGVVSLQRNTQARAPVPGSRLCLGDHILTGTDSIAELRLRDGSLITVGKNSDFMVREFRIYRRRPNVALFELGKGAFRSITGLITRRAHRYEVHTTVATIGVRGTDFWGGFGLSDDGLDVVMLAGKGVYVETAAGRVELDKPGLGTTVRGGVPEPATHWDDAKLKRAVATITP